MPDLASEYDVIGFDADHCLVKYNLRKYIELKCRVFTRDLIETEGYPEEFAEIDPKYHDLMTNNIVWDYLRGNILRIGEGKKVSIGYHGF